MKLILIALLSLFSFAALANYNDVTCSTADQNIFFQGDDHEHNFLITDIAGNKHAYTGREVKLKVPNEWVKISKKVVQLDCDQELRIALFNILEDYVIQAEITKKDNSPFAELGNVEKIEATMLCHRVQRTQGECSH